MEPRPHQWRLSPMRMITSGPLMAVCSTAIVTAVLTSGCGVVDRDSTATATWDLGPGQSLDVDTTTFTALVTRVGCNSGVTGDVNDPVIDVSDHEVVITFTVSPGEPSEATCPSNEYVPYEVELPEMLGDRELVDGQSNDVRHTP